MNCVISASVVVTRPQGLLCIKNMCELWVKKCVISASVVVQK